MAAVYWALGIHDPEIVAEFGDDVEGTYKVLRRKSAWAVISFRAVAEDDPGLRAAEAAAGARLAGPRRYALHVYRWGRETPHPTDMHVVYLEVLDQASAFVSGDTVLIQREQSPWTIDRSMPT